ncbi:MAG: ATP-binding protein, partial [Desulfobacterales bacterium]|nr:ATP-binding protein [Desulfobacterales bacterium]
NLGAFFTSDPRGPKVLEFLAQLADQFIRRQESQLKEVAALQKNVEHIKEIVAMQQSYAKVSGLTESLRPVELLDGALRMNAGAFQEHEVELVCEVAADLPCVCVDKHKVLQILVNILRNAKHACEDADRPDKRITVRAVSANERVRITVADNGVGIPPENLNRIFSHGFTTKKEGHGFGLHSSALAAKEMGGSLTVRSDGPGQGATFTLELPVDRTPPAA